MLSSRAVDGHQMYLGG